MSSHASDRSSTPLLMVFRQEIMAIGFVSVIVITLIAHALLTYTGVRHIALLNPVVQLLIILRIIGAGIMLGWILWVILYGIMLYRSYHVRSHMTSDAVLYLLVLPRPRVSPTIVNKGNALRLGMNDAILAQSLLDGLAKILKDRPIEDRISLELWSQKDGKIRWGLWIPHSELADIVQRAILALVPGIEFLKVKEDPVQRSGVRVIQEWAVKHDAMYPLAYFDDQGNDRMTIMTSAIMPSSGIRTLGWQCVITGVKSNAWKRSTRWMIRWFQRSDDVQEKTSASIMQTKLEQTGVHITLRGYVIADSRDVAHRSLDILNNTLKQFQRQINPYITQQWMPQRRRASDLLDLTQRNGRQIPRLPAPILITRHHRSILTAAEIAAMWHLPGERFLETAIWRSNRFLRPDPGYIVGKVGSDQPMNITVPLAQRPIRFGTITALTGETVYVGTTLGSLMKHGQFIGGTGAGKTEEIKNLVAQVQQQGGGITLIEHKGDIMLKFLPMIAPEYELKTVVFNPLEQDWVIGLNIFDPQFMGDHTGLSTDQLIEMLDSCLSQIDDNWASGHGMQQFAQWGAKAILSGEPEATINHLSLFLGSETYRQQVLPNVRHTQTRAWWTHNFPSLDQSKRASSDALQRRLEGFLRNDMVRRICNQTRTTVRFREIMDRRGIILATLPLNQVGHRPGTFLAMLIVNMIIMSAFNRQDLPEHERDPYLLVFDEFQESARNLDIRLFQTMIERLRSCGVGAIFAYQDIEQVGTELVNTLLNNTQFQMILSALGDDAKRWTAQYGHQGIAEEDFKSIPFPHEAYMTAARMPLTSVYRLPMWEHPRIHIAPVDADWKVFAPAQTETDAEIDHRIRQLMKMSSDAAINLLVQAPEPLWNAVNARCAIHFADQRRRIASERGLIADTAERVFTLSNLGFARPSWLVDAEQTRLALRFPRDTASPAKPQRPYSHSIQQHHGSRSAEQSSGPTMSTNNDVPDESRPVINPNKAGTALAHQTMPMPEHGAGNDTYDTMRSILAGFIGDGDDGA